MVKFKKFSRIGFMLLWILTIALVVVWDRSGGAFAVAGAGFLALLFAFTTRVWWPWLAALASAGFLINWGLAFAAGGAAPPLEVYVSVLQGALDRGASLDGAVVIAYELILPLLHALTFVILCASLLRSRRGA